MAVLCCHMQRCSSAVVSAALCVRTVLQQFIDNSSITLHCSYEEWRLPSLTTCIVHRTMLRIAGRQQLRHMVGITMT
eukprot:CAMPEP_0172881290 /NCGR_PEP_ID=MMETSP1075-20121228/117139_1 /TAXON_ID=2916 /ORGANISM="Ceratium fusus, Strain PA161109" /LENGTH=76 /DNA_ID=CAMNT_0013733711 /DNA_START=213 /DNA_END=439 /DNA_ORIENTATION=-